jgi:L-lactate dehydrogenase complex protein LldG
MPSDARETILQRIRMANVGLGDPPPIDEDWARISREFRWVPEMQQPELLTLLEHRLRDYDAHVLTVNRDSVAEGIARLLRARSASRMLVPEGFPEELLPAGPRFVTDTGLKAKEIDGFAGILTESTLAIAETGTIVLQNVPGQGRRAVSLVPDYHLCLVEASRVVATVPAAIARLQETATLPTTFISGPSATADIEMTRIKGVHGPRFLDVILVLD